MEINNCSFLKLHHVKNTMEINNCSFSKLKANQSCNCFHHEAAWTTLPPSTSSKLYSCSLQQFSSHNIWSFPYIRFDDFFRPWALACKATPQTMLQTTNHATNQDHALLILKISSIKSKTLISCKMSNSNI